MQAAEYDPRKHFRLIDQIQRGLGDVVHGSPVLAGPHSVLFHRHTVGNRDDVPD